MLESVNNSLNNNEGESQGWGNQANENSEQNPSGGPRVTLEVFSNVECPDYWERFGRWVDEEGAEWMIRIPPVPPVPPKKKSKIW